MSAKKTKPQVVWAVAPKRVAVEQFTVVAEHKGNYVALDKRMRPVLLPVLAAYPTRTTAIIGQSASRKGWVAHLGGWRSGPVIQRCTFNPNRDPADRYAPDMMYWKTEDGEVHSSRNAVFGLTKKEVLGKIAARLPGAVDGARYEVKKARELLEEEESTLKKLLHLQSECRRAGFIKKVRGK